MANHPLAPRKAPRQERSRRTVDRILDAATRIFDEVGYAATTTNDIAADAGVSIGSLYQYFPNKDSILVALAQRHVESTVAELAELMGHMGPRHSLEGALSVVLDFLVDQHQADNLHLLIAHTAPRTHELSLELDRARAQLVDLTARLLDDRIRSTRPRRRAARMVVAIVDAAVHDVVLREPPGAARRAAVDLTIATVSSMIEAASRTDPTSPARAPRR